MIIVDTSVWIDYLRGSSKMKSLFKKLLLERKILALSVVFGELLQGVRNKKEKEIIIGFWVNLPKMSENDLFIDAGILSYQEKLFSKGLGLIDSFILAAAIREGHGIWTLDKKLTEVLKSLT